MRISPLTILNMDLETKFLSGCLDACIDILFHDAIDGALPAISSVAGHGVVWDLRNMVAKLQTAVFL